MSRILLLLDNAENRHLLAEALKPRYEALLLEGQTLSDLPFDLCILDGPSLDRLWDQIKLRKEREQGTFLPFLLVTSRQDVGMATRNLWKTIDELIVSPIEKVELFARVENLLLARRLSQEFHRALMEVSPIGIIVMDREGKVLQWNQAAERIFSWGPEGRGKPLPLALKEQGETFYRLLDRVLTGETVVDVEFHLQRKDGQALEISFSIAPFRDAEGHVTYFVATAADITERKRVENEILRLNAELEQRVRERTAELERAMGKAQEADRLKSMFLATMSHELRTPLNSIIGFTGIMLQGLAGPFNAEQEKQLRMVYTSAKHLLALINDILDISKIEADQLEIVTESFKMRDLVEKVINTYTPLATTKGLSLFAHVAPEVHEITSDRRRVEQILTNLISNAIKFTDKGEVVVESEIHRNQLLTRVKDTGMGIKPEDMDKLFKPFQQIDEGLARKHEGTGLGLSISKKLVERLGGRIWAESEWGRGSTFTFSLPMGRKNHERNNPHH